MKIIAITQARYSSSRLPGKVLKKLGSKSVLDLHLSRLKKASMLTSIMVATTKEPEADEIETIATNQGLRSFRGDLFDVLDRFYQSVVQDIPDYIVRVTSDCPLIDPAYIDDAIKKFLEAKVDYASNCLKPTLPDGMDVEIFTFSALEDAWKNATLKSQREHVTSFIRDCGKYKVLSIEYPHNWGEVRMTLDTKEDYEVLDSLVVGCGENASLEEYINFLSTHPEVAGLNSKFLRNETYKK